MTNRREMLALSAAGLAAAVSNADAQLPQEKADSEFRVKNGRIRQSVMGWCFKPMPAAELAKHCREIGLVAIEGISSKDYPAVRELGLKISLVSSHGFRKGPLNPANHEFCISSLKKSIDLAVEVGCPSVITFTGMREKGIDDETAAKNCVDCWKKVIGYAEKRKVNLVLEHLNSRDDSHPMKGHPGYFGDDVDFCVELM